ncbi:MAG: glycosyltransferase family 4 protein [Bacteroidales bacterium]|nr:glycosyltransferase family 4 protein [Bacteroidales bacterium]
MNVLVINQFASAPAYNTGAGERHYYLASILAEQGYDITIISGGVNHLFTKNPHTKKLFNEEKINGGRFIWVRLRSYKSDSFFGRTISWFEFLWKLYFLPLNNYIKPDIVLVSSMSLWTAIYAIHIKGRFKIPFILEIRDIWPLTPIQIGGFSRNNPFIILFKILEKYAYNKADSIISLMPGFKEHLKTIIKDSKSVYWIPNAIDKSFLGNMNEEARVFQLGKFSVAYAGALGYANSMDCFIKAANLLKAYNIEFLVIGNGPERSHLQKLASNNPKIIFIDKVSKAEVLKLLTNVDAGFISWHDLELYKYGVSANKYNDYMLAGLPIISASNIHDDPVILADCGLQVPAGDERKIAEAILELYKMSKEERRNLGRKGYEYVISHNTYEQIALKYKICLIQTVARY